MFPILVILMSIAAIVMLIIDAINMSFLLTTLTIICGVLAFFGWCAIVHNHLNRKRTFIFFKKIMFLDRTDPKYQILFIIYDYVCGEENNLEVVKAALESVYFFPKRITRNPEKAKKKVIISNLIEYYLTLTHDDLDVSFVWDYNKNFFTWKIIGIMTLIGLVGTTILSICYQYVPNPNDVLYTALYFVFAPLFLPLIAKFFGHFI